METQLDDPSPHNGQLISVPHKDTVRLLEVYVKRSMSLNDGRIRKVFRKKEKWVTHPRDLRRHSSDPILLDMELNGNAVFEPSEDKPPANPNPQTETRPPAPEPEKRTKKTKKIKKSTLWKSFIGFFSGKSNAETTDDEQDNRSEVAEALQIEENLGISTGPEPFNKSAKKKIRRKQSLKRRLSRRLSMTKNKRDKDRIPHGDITRVEAAVSVEPTYSYYEKMSEELEKIVHEVHEKEEVKPLSDEEVINRIIALTKQQGDAIDEKMKENPTLSCFFQGMTYSSFQKLADAYLKEEAPPTLKSPTAPELVQLAFAADLTAKIAKVAKKKDTSHIMGLGQLYLGHRFQYTQECSDHPLSDSDDD